MERNKLTYVAGMLTAGGIKSRPKQIYYMFKAIKAGIKLMKSGHDVYIPHLGILIDMVSKKKFPYSQWIELGHNVLQRCDTIFLMKDWEFSPGSISEFVLAKSLDLELMYENELNK